MFDYQAGEKHKLTLMMVGLAGIVMGMFIAALFMPSPEPTHSRPMPAYMQNGDVTGVRDDAPAVAPACAGAASASAMQPTVAGVDPAVAKSLIEQWLPLAWDLSAGTAKGSQEKAIQYMTAQCADAYRKNIWTTDLAKQIEESGLQSTFNPSNISSGDVQADGSVVVAVDGTQVLTVNGKGSNSRFVKLEYLIRQTPEGLRIAGISEGGQGT